LASTRHLSRVSTQGGNDVLGKKLLGAVTAVGVTAGLMTMGATTASATVTPWTTPKIKGCGIPITLVMDASGSVVGDDQTEDAQRLEGVPAGLERHGIVRADRRLRHRLEAS
jgi:hypothetical protein